MSEERRSRDEALLGTTRGVIGEPSELPSFPAKEMTAYLTGLIFSVHRPLVTTVNAM